MGWLFPLHTITKKLLVDQVKADWQASGYTIHSTKAVAKGLWILGTTKGSDKPIIVFYLMEKAQGVWGYKDLDESMHPYYYDCPVAWLAEAPVASPAWRDGVIAHHDRKKELLEKASKIVAGKLYAVSGNWKAGGMPIKFVYVISTKPFRGTVNGYNSRIPRKMVAAMSEAP